MNAIDLAKGLDAETVKTVRLDILHNDAAAMLRRQHKAILKLRGALGALSYVTEWGGDIDSAQDDAKKALKGTEDLK